jgi:3-oxoacyl-[acyl-carrier protein] reductase
MPGRLSGKSAIVVGGTRGIGRAISRVFAAQGADVLVAGTNQEAGARTVSEIRETDGSAAFFRTDVSDRKQVSLLVDHAIALYGKVDIACCNAGIFPSATLEEMTDDEWDRVNAVNLKGAFLVVQICLPHMKRNGYGRIVLTSSITGPMTGCPGWSHYAATKAGMLGFMRTAALELARYKITINAVLPGNIMTEGLDDLGPDYLQRMEEAIPLGKLGEPEDVAYAMLYLVSDEAKYVTGQTLVVDGGQTLPESLLALCR